MFTCGSLRRNDVNDVIYGADDAREGRMGAREGRYGFTRAGCYGLGI